MWWTVFIFKAEYAKELAIVVFALFFWLSVLFFCGGNTSETGLEQIA